MENAEQYTRDGVLMHSAEFNSRPNHYSHDDLGCPHECDGNHNHPPLPEE